MLTVTHLCYFATVVTIGILLGVVIRSESLCRCEVNLATAGRGLSVRCPSCGYSEHGCRGLPAGPG